MKGAPVTVIHQKQGDTEVKIIYERVVREFGDQRDAAAQARTRLAAMQPAESGSSLSYRRVWSGPKVDPEGSVSPDGRYISFPD